RTHARVKISCVVTDLRAGGAQRVISSLANHWARRGRAITIVTLDGAASDAFELDPRVGRLRLDLEVVSATTAQAVMHTLLKIRGLRRALAALAPEVVISFIDKVNVLTLVSCQGLG